MTTFHALYRDAETTAKAARHLSDLDYRVCRRYRLWERPSDPIAAYGARLGERHRAAAAAADEASSRLGAAWDRISTGTVLLMLDEAEMHRRAIPIADMVAAIASQYRCRGQRGGWQR
jgi:hypothetical protein